VTSPWYPAPNPGGQLRRTMRVAVQEWLTAQNIRGLDTVWAYARRVAWEEAPNTDGADFSCQVAVAALRFHDVYGASTGPDDPGGVLRHFEVELRVFHRQHVADDWEDGQDDYDRIVDAICDCLHGRGRDLGRPDVILQAGSWPEDEMISCEDEEPVQDGDEGGPVDRWGVVRFTASAYLPTRYP